MTSAKKTKVTALKNVGPSRAEALLKLGVGSVEELLRLYPRAYENRGDIKLLADTNEGEKQAVCLTVATRPRKALIKRGMSLLKFRAYDDSATAEIIYFNQDYLADKFEPGKAFRFFGRTDRKRAASGKDIFSLSSPVAEEVKGEVSELAPLVPVYPLTSSLTQSLVSKLVSEAFSVVKIKDTIPECVLKQNRLASLSFALKSIHSPKCMSDLFAAKKRLVFEEFFLFALGITMSGRKRERSHGAYPMLCGDISPFTGALPYSLTNAQRRVIDEIKSDMARDIPMSRILVGDVGCGKTVCAAAAMYIAYLNGRQAALMAPTEILANQHFSDLKALLGGLGVKVELLTGSLTQSEKKRIYNSIATGETDVVIGTHALISEGVSFASIGLVINDEQHRFGISQRTALAEKGKDVHMLMMSATPIPRSLALTLYGELDMSVIDEMPPGRQRVDTFAVDESYRERLLAFMEKQIREGGQVYVVCPAIEDSEEEDLDGDIPMKDIPIGESADAVLFEKRSKAPLKSAVKYASELSERFRQSGIRVALVHGRMKTAEKDAVMRSFSEGDIHILVSTTVIEVGVNVPRASLMIVENAERFGLSQLHQLRGRVGRGERKSYCILVSDSDGESARARLDAMKNMYDGFSVAEKDLALRGPGDFLKNAAGGSLRQSGSLRFKLADMSGDYELFSAAFSSARELTAGDAELNAFPELKAEVEALFRIENNY